MKRDLIYFSPIPWRGLHQRPQHTARALARERRVLFVEPRTLHLPPPPTDEENLAFLALPVLPVNARRPFLRLLARMASRLALARDGFTRRQGIILKRKLGLLGMHDPVLLFGHPDFADLADLCPGCPVAYDHMDDVLAFSRPGPDLRRRLGRLAAHADLLSASAGKLAEQLQSLGGGEVLRIGNGVEIDHFRRGEAPSPEPAELATLPRPRALYVGSVAEWFDFDLLFAVARALPEWSFPVVGPLRPALEHRRSEAPSNVRFFGARPYDELPAWLHHADLGLIPFLSTTLTAGVDPVKLHEYLAAELPVVATPFSAELREMAEEGSLSLAAETDAFVEALKRGRDRDRDGVAMMRKASGRAWNRVLEPLISAIDSL